MTFFSTLSNVFRTRAAKLSGLGASFALAGAFMVHAHGPRIGTENLAESRQALHRIMMIGQRLMDDAQDIQSGQHLVMASVVCSAESAQRRKRDQQELRVLFQNYAVSTFLAAAFINKEYSLSERSRDIDGVFDAMDEFMSTARMVHKACALTPVHPEVNQG